MSESRATAEIVEEGMPKTARREKSITRLRWKNADVRQTKKAHVGDDVFLCADVRNIPDGTDAKIKVVEKFADGHDEDIVALDATVNGGKIECAWKVVYAEDEVYYFPKYAFAVECGGATSKESSNLKCMGWISTQLVNKEDVPLANMKYIIYLLDGSAIRGKTDGDGYVRLKNLRHGKYFISIAD